jgi:hypothetical protein
MSSAQGTHSVPSATLSSGGSISLVIFSLKSKMSGTTNDFTEVDRKMGVSNHSCLLALIVTSSLYLYQHFAWTDFCA